MQINKTFVRSIVIATCLLEDRSAAQNLCLWTASRGQKPMSKDKGVIFEAKKNRKSNEEAKESVTINIGIKRMDNDDLKTIRGKRLPITVSKTATYANIREKGIEKWKAFDRKFDSSADYVVLYEDGTRAQFMPGRRNVPYLEQLYFYSQKLWVCILLASFLLFFNISLGTEAWFKRQILHAQKLNYIL